MIENTPTDPWTPNDDAPPTRPRTPWIIGTVLVIIAVIAIVAVAFLGQGTPTTEPSPSTPPVTGESPSPAPTATVAPSPTPAATPLAEGMPADCAALYGPVRLADNLATFGVLNDELVMSDPALSRHEGVEAVRRASPSIECFWGVATEGGLQTAVTAVSDAAREQALAALAEAGFGCAPQDGGTMCTLALHNAMDSESGGTPSTDPATISAADLGEQHFFRDGIWLGTWWAFVDPRPEMTGNIAALWP